MDEDSALACVGRLSPPWHVMGGVAEDALLHSRLTRLPGDVDLLVREEQLDECLGHVKASSGQGRGAGMAAPGRPFVFGADAGIRVEVWVCTVTAEGFLLDLRAEAGPRLFRLTLPPDTFSYLAAALNGQAVQTVSPLALYYLRAASAQTRGTAQQQADDRARQAQLRQALLAGLAGVHLKPSIVSI